MDRTTALIAAVLAAALLLLGWSIAGFANPPVLDTSLSSTARAIASELPDKCATPAGYTDADWRTHMGHHPDRYAECLQ